MAVVGGIGEDNRLILLGNFFLDLPKNRSILGKFAGKSQLNQSFRV